MSAGISLGEMRKRFRRTKFHEHTKADGIQGLVKLKPTLKPENTGANRVRSFMLLLCVVSAAGNQRRVSSKSGQTDKRFVGLKLFFSQNNTMRRYCIITGRFNVASSRSAFT